MEISVQNLFCEKCKVQHDGQYGSGRFCSENCARSFSSLEKRQEINTKVSLRLTGRSFPKRKGFIAISKEANLRGITNSAINRKKRTEEKIKFAAFETLNNKTLKKLRVLFEQNYLCNICKREFIWEGKKLIPHLHHKNGDHDDDTRENLECLCPNCHSQTKSYSVNRIVSKNKHIHT